MSYRSSALKIALFAATTLATACGDSTSPGIDDTPEPPDGWLYYIVDDGDLTLERVRTDGTDHEVLLTGAEDFEVTPDGSTIFVGLYDQNADRNRLYVMDSALLEAVDVAAGIESFFSVDAALSPTGDRIVYIQDSLEGHSLSSIDLSGNVTELLPPAESFIRPLALSQDGNRVALAARTDDELVMTFINSNGGARADVSLGDIRVEGLAWSPFDDEVAFVEIEGTGADQDATVVILADGGGARTEIGLESVAGISIVGISRVTWAPNGQSLVVSAVSGSGQHLVYRMSTLTSETELISAGVGPVNAVSPDGGWAAFARMGTIWLAGPDETAIDLGATAGGGLVELQWVAN